MELLRRAALLSAAALLLPLAVAACGDEGDDDSNGNGNAGGLTVLASTTIVADWVANVGREHVSVSSIVPMNTDVHSYVVVPSDIRRIGDADVVFMIGEHLESGFEGEVTSNAQGPIVELAEGLELLPFPEMDEDDHDHEDDEHGHDDEDEHGHVHGEFDPHIFMDIDLTIAAVERIRDSLIELDGDNADDYRANTDAYVAELRELDDEIREMLSELPENRRFLVTFHDAYGYLAARYGLELIGFVVENPEEQPAASRIAELVDEIREHGIEYIFAEPQFNAQVLEQIANDSGAEVRRIPSDALSDEVPDYVSLMRAIAAGIAN